uniref:Uncharacterized protein n=1 Tax=Anguilla anguilla TaxID=7936 RepID=A0A0E9QA12_ANGAN
MAEALNGNSLASKRANEVDALVLCFTIFSH